MMPFLSKVSQHLADPGYFAERFRRSRALPLALEPEETRRRDPWEGSLAHLIERPDKLPILGLTLVVGLFIVALTWHLPAQRSVWLDLPALLGSLVAVNSYAALSMYFEIRFRMPGRALTVVTLLIIYVFALYHSTHAPAAGLRDASLFMLLSVVIAPLFKKT
jgi:hypothetical protein